MRDLERLKETTDGRAKLPETERAAGSGKQFTKRGPLTGTMNLSRKFARDGD